MKPGEVTPTSVYTLENAVKYVQDAGNAIVSYLGLDRPDVVFYGFLIIIPLFESACRVYVLSRQIGVCDRAEPPMPAEYQELMKPDMFEAFRNTYIDLYFDSMVDVVVSSIYQAVFISVNITYSVFWVRAEKLTTYVGLSSENEVYVSMGFVSLFLLFLTIPIIIFHILSIEDMVGIFMLLDYIVEAVILEVLLMPVTAAVVLVCMNVRSDIWILIPALSLTITVSTDILYPLIYFPMFELYTTVPEGVLRSSIERVAKKGKFPIDGIYVKMGSGPTGSSHIVYLHGIPGICHRIILYEEIFYKVDSFGRESGLKDREIAAFVAHEVGHWRRYYSLKKFFLTQIKVFTTCFMMNFFYHHGPVYRAVGFPEGKEPILVGLYLSRAIVLPINCLFRVVMNFFYRREEFLADQFVVRCGFEEDIKRALIRTEVFNYFPLFDSAFSLYYLSEPSLTERLQYMSSYSKVLQARRRPSSPVATFVSRGRN